MGGANLVSSCSDTANARTVKNAAFAIMNTTRPSSNLRRRRTRRTLAFVVKPKEVHRVKTSQVSRVYFHLLLAAADCRVYAICIIILNSGHRNITFSLITSNRVAQSRTWSGLPFRVFREPGAQPMLQTLRGLISAFNSTVITVFGFTHLCRWIWVGYQISIPHALLNHAQRSPGGNSMAAVPVVLNLSRYCFSLCLIQQCNPWMISRLVHPNFVHIRFPTGFFARCVTLQG